VKQHRSSLIRIVSLLILTLLAPSAHADPNSGTMTVTDHYETRRDTCTSWMLTDYPSGLDETWCRAEFALPSAFLIKCSKAQQVGFSSQTQREACRLMFLRAAGETANGYVLN
jgi:hypothetical protein